MRYRSANEIAAEWNIKVCNGTNTLRGDMTKRWSSRFAGRMLGGALALIAALCIVCIPASASAADDVAEVTTSGGTEFYATFAKAWEAAETAGTATVRLLADVDKDSHTAWPIEVASGMNITLDLNGFQIDRGVGTTAIDHGNVITVNGSLTLTGDGMIKGGNNETLGDGGGVSVNYGGEFTMRGGEITGNHSDRSGHGGGGVFVNGGAKFTMYGGKIHDNSAKNANPSHQNTSNGGGVCVDSAYGEDRGEFIMYGGEITDNKADNGGGVCVQINGTFMMKGGKITGNKANDGGGVNLDFNCTFTMEGGEITDNEATSGGGVAISSFSEFIMTGGRISGNTATSFNGGGIKLSGGGSTHAISGGEISGNTAADNGGGVWLSGGTLNLSGRLVISGNTAAGNGGGLYAGEAISTLNMSGGRICGNTAMSGGGVYSDISIFTMNGGEITGNTATNNGGGVYMRFEGLSMSGKPMISGNTVHGAANNLYLTASRIVNLTNALETGASIGVTTEITPSGSSAIAVSDSGTSAEASWTNFYSDNQSYGIFCDSQKVVLKEKNNIVASVSQNNYYAEHTSFAGAWQDAVRRTSSSADPIKITLYRDVTQGDFGNYPFEVQPTKHVILNTGNYTIDRELQASQTPGNLFAVSGSLTLTGAGKITGGYYDNNVGGVLTLRDGVFTMYGGELSGNTGGNGGGVRVSGGKFVMNGGEVSGNTSDYGGVYYDGADAGTGGGIELSGKPVISGNKDTSGNERNLYLSTGKTATITGALEAGALIGVTTETKPTKGSPVPVTGNNSADYRQYFTSDDAAYIVLNIGTGDQQVVYLSEKSVLTITYKDGGGGDYSGNNASSLIQTHTIGTATALVDGEKDLCSFDGWYTDSGCTGTALMTLGAYDYIQDITLYAKWTANTSIVTLDGNGATSTTHTTSVTATCGADMPAAIMPQRTGYTFEGYFDNQTPAKQYYNADGTSANTWDKATAATLHAKWTANSYAVALDMQGGAGGTTGINPVFDSDMPAITRPTREYTVTYDHHYAGSADTSDAAAYTFGGYFSEVSGGGTQYYTADGTSARTWNSTTIATLYADWTSASVTLPAPAREGYAFGGWYREAACTTRVGGGGDSYTPTANATLYAKWTAGSYAVALDMQGGAGGTAGINPVFDSDMPAITRPTREYTVTYDHHYTGSADTSAAAAYTFGGYFSEVSGGGTQYYTADGASARTWNSVTITTLYADWTSASVTLPAPAREGYAFGGWYREAACTTRVGGGGDSYTPTANVTLYAKWTANTCTVTLHAPDATGTGHTTSVTATYGADMPTAGVTMPTRAHYSFDGYFDAAAGGKQYYTSTGASANAWDKTDAASTLYARWTPIRYTISFTIQPQSITVTAGSITGSLTAAASVTPAGGVAATLDWYACDSAGAISGGSLGTGGTFDIPPTLTEGTHHYLCQATHTGAAATNSTVAMVTVNPVPYDPDPMENQVSGITQGQTYTQGDSVTFTITGGGSGNPRPRRGDKQYRGLRWNVNPSGDFASGDTQSFPTAGMSLGTHTLTVVFAKQVYDGTAWADISPAITDAKTVAFTLKAPPKPPKTGDNSQPLIWLSLCLLCGAGLAALLCRRRRKA